MKRRTWIGVATAGAVLAGGTVVAAYALADDGGPSSTAPVPTAPAWRRTATVERRDLVRTFDAAGTVGYGDATTVPGAAGTVTDLPATGSVVRAGEPLYEADGGPGPILLAGDRPMWRDLYAGVDDGPDVEQLERNLVELGFGDGGLVVDEEYDAETAEAVRRWEEALGAREDGRVALGDIWFGPAEVRVSAHLVEPGAEATGGVIEVTGTTRIVEVALDARQSALAVPGASVTVRLADGSTVEGTVYSVADVAQPPDAPGAPTTVTVIVAIAPTPELRDGTGVEVELVADVASGTLAVPVTAIVAQADGTFAVERVDADGVSTSLVPVTLGRFADAWVAVDGALSEGDQVVTA